MKSASMNSSFIAYWPKIVFGFNCFRGQACPPPDVKVLLAELKLNSPKNRMIDFAKLPNLSIKLTFFGFHRRPPPIQKIEIRKIVN